MVRCHETYWAELVFIPFILNPNRLLVSEKPKFTLRVNAKSMLLGSRDEDHLYVRVVKKLYCFWSVQVVLIFHIVVAQLAIG